MDIGFRVFDFGITEMTHRHKLSFSLSCLALPQVLRGLKKRRPRVIPALGRGRVGFAS